MNGQAALKGVTKEQTASLETALLHCARGALAVRTQMRTAQQGSIPLTWTSTIRAAQRDAQAEADPTLLVSGPEALARIRAAVA